LVDGSGVVNGSGVFGDGNRFSGEEGLIDSEGGGFDLQNSDISWDLVTNSNVNDITWNQITGSDLLDLTWSILSEYLGHGWFVFFQGFDSRFSILFLPDTDASVGNQNSQNNQWFDESAQHRVTLFMIFEKSQNKGDTGGGKKNSDQKIFELFDNHSPEGFTFFGWHFISAPLLSVGFNLEL
jgi:hypothetical protein